MKQDPTDEPASELLKRIAAEKARLVKAGAIKPERTGKKRVSPPVHFALPMGWEWAHLQAVCKFWPHLTAILETLDEDSGDI